MKTFNLAQNTTGNTNNAPAQYKISQYSIDEIRSRLAEISMRSKMMSYDNAENIRKIEMLLGELSPIAPISTASNCSASNTVPDCTTSNTTASKTTEIAPANQVPEKKEYEEPMIQRLMELSKSDVMKELEEIVSHFERHYQKEFRQSVIFDGLFFEVHAKMFSECEMQNLCREMEQVLRYANNVCSHFSLDFTVSCEFAVKEENNLVIGKYFDCIANLQSYLVYHGYKPVVDVTMNYKSMMEINDPNGDGDDGSIVKITLTSNVD